MNLKKIELHGFKSFPDKIEIDFKSNMTGIVGSNGCGKSNVVEAVRWVLGEQAPGVLRCKKMNEVIFNGSEKRGSLSYCEVSLYLDNEAKSYPCDYDEVVITRKIYRSGDGEYFINKKVCRRIDIINLFRDSGVGRDGYSIIGQGKIEDILSTKPEERRKIFEEAAGISKHKADKEDAERRLGRTRENMEKLQFMLDELGKNLAPLEKEAENASKVRLLKEQLKYIDVKYFLHQCENSSTQKDILTQKLAKTSKEYQNTENDLFMLAADYNKTMQAMTDSDDALNAFKEQLTNVRIAAEKKRGETGKMSERLNYLRIQDNTLNSEMVQCETRILDKNQEIDNKMSLYNEKKLILNEKDATFRLVKEEFERISDSVERQEKEIEKSKQLLMDNMGKLSEINTDKAKLEIERDMLKDALEQSKRDLVQKNSIYDGIIKERDNLSNQLDILLAERNEKSKEQALSLKNYKDASEELRHVREKERELEARKNELRVKISLVEEHIKDYAGYQDVVRRLMNEGQHNPNIGRLILGTVGDVLTVPKDLQIAIEVALGGSIQNIIAETPYDVSILLDLLREKGFGRATFLPISTVRSNPLSSDFNRALNEEGVIGVASELVKCDKKFDGIISNLLGRTVIVDDKETAIEISKKYRQGFRIVTLNGELYAQSGAITGGSPPGRNTRILSKETELAELNKKLKNVSSEFDNIKLDIVSLSEEVSKIESGVKVIEARIHKLDIEIENLNVRINGADSEALLHKQEIDKFIEQNKVNSIRITALNEHIKSASASSDAFTSERSSADDFINAAHDKYVSDKQRRNELNAKVNDLLMEIGTLKSETEVLERDIVSARSDIKSITNQLLELKSRKVSNDKELQTVGEIIEKTSVDDEFKEEVNNLKQKIEEKEEVKKRAQARLVEIDEQKDIINKKLADINERKIKDAGALERLDIDIENLTVRIRENYDFDLDAAKEFMTTQTDKEGFEFDIDKAQGEIISLRRKIERIGDVNELAETQFIVEKERYEKLKFQIDDLRAAESDLLNIINDLLKDMTEKFVTSFNLINENFQTVFKELFNGGSARLELETQEGADVLQAGIEIIAVPPGKKVNRNSLLSGGERALTAIGILFAILKLKPMPFCFLDEIDAALDPANASLLVQYLQKYSKDTQFIMVTHRIPTMERLEFLYGVTMQMGISKLVSVQLGDAIKMVQGDNK